MNFGYYVWRVYGLRDDIEIFAMEGEFKKRPISIFMRAVCFGKTSLN